jgi:hypothetical protein
MKPKLCSVTYLTVKRLEDEAFIVSHATESVPFVTGVESERVVLVYAIRKLQFVQQVVLLFR